MGDYSAQNAPAILMPGCPLRLPELAGRTLDEGGSHMNEEIIAAIINAAALILVALIDHLV